MKEITKEPENGEHRKKKQWNNSLKDWGRDSERMTMYWWIEENMHWYVADAYNWPPN